MMQVCSNFCFFCMGKSKFCDKFSFQTDISFLIPQYTYLRSYQEGSQRGARRPWPPTIVLPRLVLRVQNKQFIILPQPWIVVSRPKFPRNLRIYAGKSPAWKNLLGFFGVKASPAKKFEDFRGKKALPRFFFFLAPLISKSYLPPWQAHKKKSYSCFEFRWIFYYYLNTPGPLLVRENGRLRSPHYWKSALLESYYRNIAKTHY